MKLLKTIFASALVLSLLAACAQPPKAPPENQPTSQPTAQPQNTEEKKDETISEEQAKKEMALPVSVLLDEKQSLVKVTKGDKVVAQLPVNYAQEGFPEVHEIKETAKSYYFSTCATGFGGYILYRFCYGPSYRFDRVTNKIEKILDSGEIHDISPKEDAFAWTGNGAQFVNKIMVRDVATKADKSFIVSEKYSQFGDVKFSPDGKKFAYGAVVGDPENEEGSVIIVEIATGKETYVVKDKPEDIYAINGWKDNNTVDYTTMGGD